MNTKGYNFRWTKESTDQRTLQLQSETPHDQMYWLEFAWAIDQDNTSFWLLLSGQICNTELDHATIC